MAKILLTFLLSDIFKFSDRVTPPKQIGVETEGMIILNNRKCCDWDQVSTGKYPFNHVVEERRNPMARASSFSELAEIPTALLLESTWMHKRVAPRHWAIADMVMIDEYCCPATKWYTAKATPAKTA